MAIKQLSENIINQIAAGEVIERPASVVKELVENALDAGARRVELITAGGGLTLIRVVDDGGGIPPEQLPLAVSRHCTSKLSDNIHDIRSLGFRGEALPSIGSVARLSMRSRPKNAENAAEIVVDGGKLSSVRPVAANHGTMVEIRDLFFSTPARLKFMKSERAESSAITDVIKRISLAFPAVRFTISGSDRTMLDLPTVPEDGDGLLRRIAQVLGQEFADNALPIDAERSGVRLTGYVSIPAYSRGNALHQYVYVNDRPIRDKLIAGAIRAAYMDALPRDRHALAALFLQIDPELVDVNVHPAKADVRFRDPGLVRGLLIGAIREALDTRGVRSSTSGASSMLEAFRIPEHRSTSHHRFYGGETRPSAQWSPVTSPSRPLAPAGLAEAAVPFLDIASAPSADGHAGLQDFGQETARHPLGAARAQVHENYIIAQTEGSLIIVDQHAAHERLVYEALKEAIHAKPLPSQGLLIPEIVDLPEDDVDRLDRHTEFLTRLGLHIERFGPGAIAVRETPAMLGQVDAASLIRDLADEIAEADTTNLLRERIDHIAATMACHGSVRSGRRLRVEEMNALLRQMEATPGSGTCNHGRPTYIELKLPDIERLFGRR